MRYYCSPDTLEPLALSFDSVSEAREVFYAGPRTISCGETPERSAVIVGTAHKIRSILEGRRALADIVLVGEEAVYALEGLGRMAGLESAADARHSEAARTILLQQTESTVISESFAVPVAEARDTQA